MTSWEFLMTDIFALGLVLSRVSGFAVTAPFISEEYVPQRFKLLGIILVSIMILPNVKMVESLSWESYFWLSPMEFGIGAAIGFGTKLIISAVGSAGDGISEMIGMRFHAGGGIEMERAGLGEILYIFAALLMFGFGGDRYIIKTFLDMYESIPIGAFRMGIVPLQPMIRYGEAFFVAVVKLSIPILSVMILFYAVAGLFVHFFPDWDIFAMIFPGALIIGMWCLFMFSPQFLEMFQTLFSDSLELMQEVF